MHDTTTGRRPWPRIVFAAAWSAATLVFAYEAIRGVGVFDGPAGLPMLALALLCTVALLWWLPGPPLPDIGASKTRRGLFSLAVLAGAAALLTLYATLGFGLLWVLCGVAALVLLVLRPRLERREVVYALGLALVASVAGLGHGGEPVPPVVWAVMQVPLVFFGLLAGWALLRHTGLLQAGIGRSLLLTEGAGAALRGGLWGMALALPWALFNVAQGWDAGNAWIRAWWAPLVALQPGIAEEAWSRVLLVSLVFVPLSRLGRTRTALAWAAVICGYWFALLHTQGSNPLSALAGTLLIGTLASLPLTYLWLRRGLEPAMAFHFAVDFVQWAAVLLIGGRG